MSVVNTAYMAGLALGPALAGRGHEGEASRSGRPAWRAPVAVSAGGLLTLVAASAGLDAAGAAARTRTEALPDRRQSFPPLGVVAVMLTITFADMFATAALAPW